MKVKSSQPTAGRQLCHRSCPLRLRRSPGTGGGTGQWVLAESEVGYRVTVSSRGYLRVYLGRRHPYANRSGGQWLHRFIVMDHLGRQLRPDEHVHHLTGDKWTTSLADLEVVLAEYHGSLHAWHTVLARDSHGRWVELDRPEPTLPAARWGAVIGSRAGELAASGASPPS